MAKRRRSMQKTIQELLEAHGLWEMFLAEPDEFYVKIASEPYMDLSIQRNPEGHVSVAHYYTQNGDAVPDPDMVFHKDNWYVVECSQNMGQYTRVSAGRYNPGLEELAQFFAINIRHQGFYEGTVLRLVTPQVEVNNEVVTDLLGHLSAGIKTKITRRVLSSGGQNV